MIDRRFRKRMARYLAEREKRSIQALEDLEIEEWFDFWHLHPDWKMRGNRVRPMVAALTLRLLEKAESLVAGRRDPVQVWAQLCENTGYTAIYLHSPNPNGTEYPHAFDDVEWGIAEPEELRGLIPSTHALGLQRWDGEKIYLIRRRD
jgi:hypothetical protein